jgi:hypothetical protein
MTETTARKQAGIFTRMPAWIRRRQRDLSDRVHGAGDECARQHGWEITKSTRRFGFGARGYRDPRFDDRRWQLGRQQIVGPAGARTDANRWNKASNYQADRKPGGVTWLRQRPPTKSNSTR